MADPTDHDTNAPATGMTLEEVAKMGPLPGVVADDAAEEHGEDDSGTGDEEGHSILGAILPHPQTPDRDTR